MTTRTFDSRSLVGLFALGALLSSLLSAPAAASPSFPVCWESEIQGGYGPERINLCASQDADTNQVMGAVRHVSGFNTYGAVSVWAAPYGHFTCDQLVAWSATEALYTATYTTPGAIPLDPATNKNVNNFCVVYRYVNAQGGWSTEGQMFSVFPLVKRWR